PRNARHQLGRTAAALPGGEGIRPERSPRTLGKLAGAAHAKCIHLAPKTLGRCGDGQEGSVVGRAQSERGQIGQRSRNRVDTGGRTIRGVELDYDFWHTNILPLSSLITKQSQQSVEKFLRA